MKILIIDVNCKNSSTGQIVYNMYKYYNSTNNTASVCYGRGKKVKEKNIFKFGLDIETYIHALLTRITGYTGCFSYVSTQRLIRYIKKFKPDIVHIHEMHAYFLNITQLLSYLSDNNIPVIHTLHCEFSYTGKCGHSKECNKWKTTCYKCPHLKDYPSSLFFDQTEKMFNNKRKAFLTMKKIAYVTPSKWLFLRTKESFLKKQDIRLIHNSIDTSIFHGYEKNSVREELQLPINQRIILSLRPNLMSENKGGQYVLELAKQMKDILFILIGTGSIKYYKDNVMCLGNIYDKETLAKYYSGADAFLICSKNENFPTTCIEAICCGTPVVGFDAGGAKEVTLERFGNFVCYGDIEALRKEIIKIVYHHNNTNDDYEVAREHYSIERMCKEYLELYEYVKGDL